jgi:glycosyltransferase involved in cell wall biosynthesis
MTSVLSIICPVRNEEESCQVLFNALILTRKRLKKKYGIDTELIFVDNASSDKTILKLQKLFADTSKVLILRHIRNLGMQNSLMTGIVNSKGDAVVVLQSDLQDPPQLVDQLVESWLKGNKYVITKMKKRNSGFFDTQSRNLGYLFLNLVAGVRVVRNAGDFWLIDKSIVTQIKDLRTPRPFFRTFIPSLTDVDEILMYDRKPRETGKTNFNWFGKYEFFIDAILSNPLRIISGFMIAGVFTFIISMASFVVAMFSIIPSITILRSVFFLIASLVVIQLSLVLEYLLRIYLDFPNTIGKTHSSEIIVRNS